jgi:hypothetical protein
MENSKCLLRVYLLALVVFGAIKAVFISSDEESLKSLEHDVNLPLYLFSI